MNYSNRLEEDIIKKVLLIFLILCANFIHAQKDSTTKSTPQIDSSSVTKLSLSDTTKFSMQKSAWGSVLRSAIIPGFGQFYNESYWKVPIFWGVLGYLGYQWNTNNKTYKTYKDLFNGSITEENKEGNTSYYNQREKFRDQRDMFAVFIGLTYFLNLIDAYVDAHLFDFDVEADASTKSYQVLLRIKL